MARQLRRHAARGAPLALHLRQSADGALGEGARRGVDPRSARGRRFRVRRRDERRRRAQSGLRELYPFSRLSEPANVLVMPAIHSASISTSLLATAGGATVIGPVLTGLAKPIQIAPLGGTVSDIVTYATLAAFQAAEAASRAEGELRCRTHKLRAERARACSRRWRSSAIAARWSCWRSASPPACPICSSSTPCRPGCAWRACRSR